MKQSLIVSSLVLLLSIVSAPAAFAQGAQNRDRSFVLGGGGSHIGVSIRDSRESDLATAKLTRVEGVVVEAVQPGTPAERAGLKSGDLVLEYDGEHVRSARHFTRLVQETPAGRKVQVVVNRAGTRELLTVTPEEGSSGSFDLGELRDRLEHNFPGLSMEPGRRMAEGRLGMAVTPLSSQLAGYFGVSGGVLVNEVAADSPAARAGIKAGDVVTAINGRTVSTPGDIAEIVRSAEGGSTLDLGLTRDKRNLKIQVQLGGSSRRTDRNSVGI